MKLKIIIDLSVVPYESSKRIRKEKENGKEQTLQTPQEQSSVIDA